MGILEVLSFSFFSVTNTDFVALFFLHFQDTLLKDLPENGIIDDKKFYQMNVDAYLNAFKLIRIKKGYDYINGFDSDIVENFHLK